MRVSYRTARDGNLEASTDGGNTWFVYAPPGTTSIIFTVGNSGGGGGQAGAAGHLSPPIPSPSPPPDPFGEAVRAAQALPDPDPASAYVPDDFTAPGFDADAAYRRAMGG